MICSRWQRQKVALVGCEDIAWNPPGVLSGDEHLRSRSIPHKTALNEALGIGVTPEAQHSPPPKQLESGSVRL